MENKIIKRPLPTLLELTEETELSKKLNALTVLLNQEPPKDWVKEHPIAKIKKDGKSVPVKYVPIERIDYLLKRIYIGDFHEIKFPPCVLGNSVCVTVTLYVKNPISGEWEHQDGVGAVPMQTDAGEGATALDKLKSNAVQLAAPAAESYARKDAAEKLGKLFGRDLNVADIDYYGIYRQPIDENELIELYELKKASLNSRDQLNAERIINEKEKPSYNKLYHLLKGA